MAWTYQVTTAGTLTLPTGSKLLRVWVESHDNAATVNIFGKGAILFNGSAGAGNHVTANLTFDHGKAIASGTGAAAQVVFTLTTSGLVEYDTPPGT